jgi:haloacetate dehalogenase
MGGGTAAVGRRDALNRVFEVFENDLVEGDGLPIFVRHGGPGSVVLSLHWHLCTSAT